MAKLYLKFEQTVLKEVPARGVVTIGRTPDNSVQIDNPAVSTRHATVSVEGGQYVIEDNGSLNGTFVNGRRVQKTALHNGDVIGVGKHTLVFQMDAGEAAPSAPATVVEHPKPAMAKMQPTMVLDTKKAREMLAAAATGSLPAGSEHMAEHAAAVVAKERLAMLTVIKGKADQKQYVLTGKLTVIGKSEMASVRIKGWFKPQVAAVVSKRENKYLIAPSEKRSKLKVNGATLTVQQELRDGDIIDAAGVQLSFAYV